MQVTFTFEANTKRALYAQLTPVLEHLHRRGVKTTLRAILASSVALDIDDLSDKIHAKGVVDKISAMTDINVQHVEITYSNDEPIIHDLGLMQRIRDLKTTRISHAASLPVITVSILGMAECLALAGIKGPDTTMHCTLSLPVKDDATTIYQALSSSTSFNLKINAFSEGRTPQVHAMLMKELDAWCGRNLATIPYKNKDLYAGTVTVNDICNLAKNDVIVFGYVVELFHKNTKYVDIVFNFRTKDQSAVGDLVKGFTSAIRS